MRNLLFTICFLGGFFFVSAQSINVGALANKRKNLESVISQEKNFGSDTAALKTFLQPLVKAKNTKAKIIYYGLLANGFSKYYDNLNETSDSLYKQSIQAAKKAGHLSLEIWTQLNYAVYLYDFRNMNGALPVFMDAINAIQNIDPKEMIFPGQSFKKIGYYMGTIGDNAEAILYLKKAVQFIDNDTPEHAAILDNTGLYYFYSGDLEKAAQYFTNASVMAKKIGDDVRYGKALGNLALIHQKNGDYETAIRLVEEDIDYSETHESHQNTMYAYTLLGRLYLDNNNVPAAKEALNKAEAIAVSKSYFQASELEIIKLKIGILKKLGREEDELIARRRLSELEDSLLKTDGDMALNRANWLAQKTKYLQQLDAADAQFKDELQKKRIYLALSVVAVLLIVVVIVNAAKKLKKRRSDYESMVMHFEKEKQKFETELNQTQQDLSAQVHYRKEKNLQIKQLNTEIERIRESPSFYIEQEKGELQKLLGSHLMTEENWINFKREFKKEYPGWYQEILKEFPKLTESNLRIVLLIKLGFSNTEISGLLGITPDAVKKAKQRLRKKLGDRSDTLFEILTT